MTRKRYLGALYVLTVLVTVGLFAAALYRKGVAAYPPYDFDAYNRLEFFLPLLVAEYLLWRTTVYFFCTAERSVRKTVFTVLYGLLGLGILVFAVFSNVKWWPADTPDVKWCLLGAYTALRGIDALADVIRAYVRIRSGEGKMRVVAEFCFIVIMLSAAAFVMIGCVLLWEVLRSPSWFGAVFAALLLTWFIPVLLAEGLLWRGVLCMIRGTGGRVFPFLYAGLAVMIFISFGGRFFIGFRLPWVPVCVYGVVQAVDTLLNDVRRPCGEGDQE